MVYPWGFPVVNPKIKEGKLQVIPRKPHVRLWKVCTRKRKESPGFPHELTEQVEHTNIMLLPIFLEKEEVQYGFYNAFFPSDKK